MAVFDVAVIGCGLFGSAAVRHLSERGATVCAVGAGPGDPSDVWPGQVFSSHDDEARLTRRQDRDEFWAPVTERAISNYGALEAASGIDFHAPVGCLISSRLGGDGVNPDPREMMLAQSIEHDYFAPGDRSWKSRWPDLEFPDTHYVAFEPGPAGHIRPKRLIAAQRTVAETAGAVFVDDTVVGVEHRGDHELVTTRSGRAIEARKVLVAAGAFTNVHGLLERPVPLELKTEAVILGEVAPDEGERLATVPTVKYLNDIDRPPSAGLEAIYMIGPLRYPDGRYYIKMGANTVLDEYPTTLEELQAWFHTDPDAEYLPLFQPALEALWPEVEFRSFTTRPCIITYTADRTPLIEQVGAGVYVATAGNGGGAKGSDAWGERAAEVVFGPSRHHFT